MQEKTQNYLLIAIQRLEEAVQQIKKQNESLQKKEAAHVLLEALKEQIKNENTRTATR